MEPTLEMKENAERKDFVKSEIMDDIKKEISETRLCNCDDYEVCAYENS